MTHSTGSSKSTRNPEALTVVSCGPQSECQQAPAYHSRKHGRLSLTISAKRLLQVSEDGQTLTSQQGGFAVRLHAQQTLKWLDIRSIQLVPVKKYGPPTPLEELDIKSPEDILGADRGTKNHLAVSSGQRAHHPGGETTAHQTAQAPAPHHGQTP